MTKKPAAIAARLRKAVAEGRYADARDLAATYQTELEAAARALVPDSPGVHALEICSRQLLEWALKAARAARAHHSAQWKELNHSHSPYPAAAVPAGSSWEFDA